MNLIRYHYTHITKQLFFLVCFFYTLLHFTVILEIYMFKLPGFYEQLNFPLTVITYIIVFILLFFLFIEHRLCYSIYDDQQIAYYNLILRKCRTLKYEDAKTAIFGTFGVKFYDKEDVNEKEDKPVFFLPFFRGGLIEPVQINNFFKMLKERENLRVIKKFKVLPGYTKKWRFVAIFYGMLAVVCFMNCATPITTVVVLFQNH